MKKVCILGLGYIGLPTACVFARHGLQVTSVDTNEHVVDTLNSGSVHIYEPGLGELVQEVLARGRLQVSHCPEPSDAFIIAVPTPFSIESGEEAV